MREMHYGIGYDIHRLAPSRRLVLGGIVIPHTAGLDGHSDADVVTHAVMDALLGAAALGDIGQHFPPSDPAFADANSLVLLGMVHDLLRAAGWQAVNIDVTVVAERPRLAPYTRDMRRRIAEVLALDIAAVSVKATTNEGLGPEGREEGISATAVASIVRARAR